MTKTQDDIAALSGFIAANPRLVVLTGAGISLASGIPTYRDQEGRWRHSDPIKHQEFLQDADKRRRYWARSQRGWPAVRDASPNDAHLALARLERAGYVRSVITQNVDRLHQRAGSREVIDLHGRLDRVVCLSCGEIICRNQVQQDLHRLNTRKDRQVGTTPRPDGDVDIPDEIVAATRVPSCHVCRGVLMPDVVFFGGTVPRPRVDACMRALEEADALLAIGSSLQVFSGFRFCRRAEQLGKPLAIVNPGKTRADSMADLRIRQDCAKVLASMASELFTTSACDNPSYTDAGA